MKNKKKSGYIMWIGRDEGLLKMVLDGRRKGKRTGGRPRMGTIDDEGEDSMWECRGG